MIVRSRSRPTMCDGWVGFSNDDGRKMIYWVRSSSSDSQLAAAHIFFSVFAGTVSPDRVSFVISSTIFFRTVYKQYKIENLRWFSGVRIADEVLNNILQTGYFSDWLEGKLLYYQYVKYLMIYSNCRGSFQCVCHLFSQFKILESSLHETLLSLLSDIYAQYSFHDVYSSFSCNWKLSAAFTTLLCVAEAVREVFY